MVSATPIATARQAFKTLLDNASLDVAVERDGLPYGGASSRSIVIQPIAGTTVTFGGENRTATEKGEALQVHIQLDVRHETSQMRDQVAEKVLAAVQAGRGTLRTAGLVNPRLVENHNAGDDPVEGVQIYRHVIRYIVEVLLTRAA